MTHGYPRTASFTLILFLLLTTGLTGCKQGKPEAEAPPPDPMLVKPSSALVAQLTIEPVGTAPVSDTLRVAGRIDFDEMNLTRIGSSVTGRVTEIKANLGDPVRTGTILARIHSSELSTAQLAYLKARSQMELNRRNLERAQSLFATDVISFAELQRRTNEFEISSAETRAAQDQLRVLGLPAKSIEQLASTGQIDSNTPVVTTQNGTVVVRKLAIGQVVEPTESLFVVADLSRVWAIAQVPEQQVSLVKQGNSVKIEVPALNNEILTGKLIYVSQTIDPDTRTVLVRTELDNRDGRLKPAMLASVLIEATPEEKTIVPASAVVRENDMDHVFVVSGASEFRLTRVKVGPESSGHRVVLEGLKPGSQIVSKGAFHLNNERNRSSE